MDVASAPTSLQVQINHIDYALCAPGPLDNSDLPLVPVIRVFGPTADGNQHACVHIHQVYPYCFVEYRGSLVAADVRNFCTRLRRSLNHAIALTLRRNPDSPSSRYVRAVFLVKGIPFYGFHSAYSPFIKVLINNPAHLTRVVKILQSGSIMDTRFRVYESHIGFTLQFFSDFGLHGCGWLELGDIFQRQKHDDSSQISPPNELTFPQSPHLPVSLMPLEVDVIAHQIRNRHHLNARDLHSKLKIGDQSDHGDPLVFSVRELWEDERKRRLSRGLHPSPELPVDPSPSSRGAGAQWVSETRWWDELRKRLEGEKDDDFQEGPTPEWEKFILTTFESVKAIWNLKDDSKVSAAEITSDNLPEDIQVDMSILTSQEIDLFEDLQANDEHEFEREEEQDEDQEKEDQDHLDEEEDGASNVEDDELPTSDLQTERPQSPNPFLDNTGISTLPGEFILHGSLESRPGSQDLAQRPIIRTSKQEIHEEQSALPLDPPTTHTLRPKSDHESQSQRPIVQPLKPSSIALNTDYPSRTTSSAHATKRRKLQRPSVSVPLLPRAISMVSFHQKINFDCLFSYRPQPPTTPDLLASLGHYNLPTKIYQSAYYSDENDAPEEPSEFGGLTFSLQGGRDIETLKEWVPTCRTLDFLPCDQYPEAPVAFGWEYAGSPPSYKEAKKWLTSDQARHLSEIRGRRLRSQILGPTIPDKYGIKATLGIKDSSNREQLDMSILALELFAPPSDDRAPDPEQDEILAAFYSFQDWKGVLKTGIVAVRSKQFHDKRLRTFPMDMVSDELDLVNRLVDLIRELDPGILVGWDIQYGSWGYLNHRAQLRDFDLSDLISRAPIVRVGVAEQWENRRNSSFKVAGRHCLNLWRIMRVELTLNVYTFENVVFQVLKKRVPKYSMWTLAQWYYDDVTRTARLMEYFANRTSLLLDVLAQTEIITKTAEFARVFGIDFYSVFTRGSQYKVESFMFRIAKPESFVLPSPSRDDVGQQNAAECMPLIMEPEAGFYSSPLIVLDFQSLYPSVMIAYNYCYSTCLGRIANFQGRNKLGISELNLPPGLLAKLQDHINIAPNGIMYVKSEVRKGLIGRMLNEILDTRVMVKQAMKGCRDDKALQRVLNARQLGLKYIANVTYGYTGATFSGRMPAVEIADSIVQTGRETLERAIHLVNGTAKWGAKVVYGDTDSLFIYLKGRTKEQAFRIGHEIADTVTAMNPVPIKLKFEKVYLPCVLMAKKRYVGAAYEDVDTAEPMFDAKGIETVRRDGVVAQAKMTEKCLKILFRTQDLSEVKAYCCNSWRSILDDEVTIQDFIFAKEVRLGSYSEKGVPPPGAVVAQRLINVYRDKSISQHGERVQYVIAEGEPGERLVDRALSPMELLENAAACLDAEYYITRVLIPPLERIFNLVGADVRQWYTDLPRDAPEGPSSPTKEKERASTPSTPENPTLDDQECVICEGSGALGPDDVICYDCLIEKQQTTTRMLSQRRLNDLRLQETHQVCRTCTHSSPSDSIECVSLDCPWFYARIKADDMAEESEELHNLVELVEAFDPDAIYEVDAEFEPEQAPYDNADMEDWE